MCKTMFAPSRSSLPFREGKLTHETNFTTLYRIKQKTREDLKTEVNMSHLATYRLHSLKGQASLIGIMILIMIHLEKVHKIVLLSFPK